jgi:hypothetical protein
MYVAYRLIGAVYILVLCFICCKIPTRFCCKLTKEPTRPQQTHVSLFHLSNVMAERKKGGHLKMLCRIDLCEDRRGATLHFMATPGAGCDLHICVKMLCRFGSTSE